MRRKPIHSRAGACLPARDNYLHAPPLGRTHLDGHGVKYRFHDYKVAGIEKGTLEGRIKKAGWEALLNRAARHGTGR
jgi:hypothetical protein